VRKPPKDGRESAFRCRSAQLLLPSDVSPARANELTTALTGFGDGKTIIVHDYGKAKSQLTFYTWLPDIAIFTLQLRL
jgi:hypothetical protein